MNIDQIIGKLMRDGSLGEEKSSLEAWKEEAEDNIKALEDMRKIASLSSTLIGYEDFNANNAWNSFSSKLENNNVNSQSKNNNKTSLFTLRRISQIAAVSSNKLGIL